ncbi:MAG: decarboxylating 6-phosphogluconate dehydrogenase [Burkholderiaceae bacterium]|nr:decarboxylating 6-phosphogluconate dehydrogenase [Burkholderiaceae bacterium]
MNPIAMVGLGRMGANMARRLARAGITVHGYDAAPGARESLKGESGVHTHASLADSVSALRAAQTGRAGIIVWLMLPAGDITEATLTELQGLLVPGDVLVEGGNSNYLDSQRRARAAAAAGLHYLDCGVSGGVWGLANGYCLSLGGEADAVALVAPFAQALAPTPQTGWLHCGASGSGHFVKMIHNGIEYGMMQSLAEGFALLEGRKDLALPLADIAELWRHSSVVRSWLLDLTAGALAEPGALQALAPHVSDSGEGRWTVDEAVRQGTPAPVIAASLMSRFDSQGKADTGNRLLSLMRQAFGGHAVLKRDDAP